MGEAAEDLIDSSLFYDEEEEYYDEDYYDED